MANDFGVLDRAIDELTRLRARCAELEAERDRWKASAEMACLEPPDNCDCAGCALADERHGLRKGDG